MPIPLLLFNQIKWSLTNSYSGVIELTSVRVLGWIAEWLRVQWLYKQVNVKVFSCDRRVLLAVLKTMRLPEVRNAALTKADLILLPQSCKRIFILAYNSHPGWFDFKSLIIHEETWEETYWVKVFLSWGSICPDLRKVFTAWIKLSDIRSSFRDIWFISSIDDSHLKESLSHKSELIFKALISCDRKIWGIFLIPPCKDLMVVSLIINEECGAQIMSKNYCFIDDEN